MHLKVLTPGSFYIPSDTPLKFLILFKGDKFPVKIEGAMEGFFTETKIKYKVYEYDLKCKEGRVVIADNNGAEYVEFEAVKEMPEPSMLKLVI